MNKNRSAHYIEFIKTTYENLITDLGIWVGNFVAKLNGEPAPQYTAAENTVSRRAASSAKQKAVQREEESLAEDLPENDFLSDERQDIADWLKKVKFRSKFFMGADEVDVWKKIGQLNRMYDKALLAERARYDALLRQYMESRTDSSDRAVCEVEDEDSAKGEQLRTREDNPEKTADGSDEVRVHQPDTESGGDSSDRVSDPDADVPDNSGAGE